MLLDFLSTFFGFKTREKRPFFYVISLAGSVLSAVAAGRMRVHYVLVDALVGGLFLEMTTSYLCPKPLRDYMYYVVPMLMTISLIINKKADFSMVYRPLTITQ